MLLLVECPGESRLSSCPAWKHLRMPQPCSQVCLCVLVPTHQHYVQRVLQQSQPQPVQPRPPSSPVVRQRQEHVIPLPVPLPSAAAAPPAPTACELSAAAAPRCRGVCTSRLPRALAQQPLQLLLWQVPKHIEHHSKCSGLQPQHQRLHCGKPQKVPQQQLPSWRVCAIKLWAAAAWLCGLAGLVVDDSDCGCAAGIKRCSCAHPWGVQEAMIQL